jgi:hypothetical protein
MDIFDKAINIKIFVCVGTEKQVYSLLLLLLAAAAMTMVMMMIMIVKSDTKGKTDTSPLQRTN